MEKLKKPEGFFSWFYKQKLFWGILIFIFVMRMFNYILYFLAGELLYFPLFTEIGYFIGFYFLNLIFFSILHYYYKKGFREALKK